MSKHQESKAVRPNDRPYRVTQLFGFQTPGSLVVGAALAVAVLFSNAARAADEPRVVATIKPIHSLVAQVMSGVASPRLLVEGAASPHTYALKPSDARALHSAQLVFRVSADLEPFTRKIVASLPSTVTVVTLKDASGVATLAQRTGDTFERHAHEEEEDHESAPSDAHNDHDHHGDNHDGDDHDDHGDHAEGTTDSHIWLDPDNAKAMTRAIADALAKTYPEHKETFEANASKALSEIDATSADITHELEPLKGVPFVVFHDAYQYFERRFGINAIGSITVSPDIQPSAKRLTAIREKIRALGAECVFAEPQFKSKLVDAVIEGTKARAGTLDPEGALVEPGPGLYSTLLRNLAAGLKRCLAEPA